MVFSTLISLVEPPPPSRPFRAVQIGSTFLKSGHKRFSSTCYPSVGILEFFCKGGHPLSLRADSEPKTIAILAGQDLWLEGNHCGLEIGPVVRDGTRHGMTSSKRGEVYGGEQEGAGSYTQFPEFIL